MFSTDKVWLQPKYRWPLLLEVLREADADIISLVSPNGKLVDQSSAGPDEAEPSYCRVPDGAGEWQKCESTFGAANIPFACGNGVLDEGEAAHLCEYAPMVQNDFNIARIHMNNV